MVGELRRVDVIGSRVPVCRNYVPCQQVSETLTDQYVDNSFQSLKDLVLHSPGAAARIASCYESRGEMP